MQLQGVTIALRQRLPWEATDLGVALVRAHARSIYVAWCLVTLPVWCVVNALGVALEAPWAALLAMWWLKPAFDRVPLFAISRAVFGQTPPARAIVGAQFGWGWRAIAPWLLWRRLHPGRLLLLPVDLLEHAAGTMRRERVRVLTRGEAGPRNQLVMLGAEFELSLSVATVFLVLMFVPSDFLSEAAGNLFRHLFDNPPMWAKVALNGCVWIGTSLVEPFLVGAGFGLYLNRRVQLEAWDVEHAFRRLAARLSKAAQPVCLVLLLGGAYLGAGAASATECASPQASTAADGSAAGASCGQPHPDAVHTTVRQQFGIAYRADGGRFAKAAQAAHAGLFRTVRESFWQSTNTPSIKTAPPGWGGGIGEPVGLLARYGLWILALAVAGVVLYHHRRWIGWIRDIAAADAPAAVQTVAIARPRELPSDIPGAVRALWARGEQRAALALLYQAAVQRLSTRLGTALPPGATEGECLARCRRLDDRRFAGLFARIVACWQAAAYARRWPETASLDALLDEWAEPASAPGAIDRPSAGVVGP